MPADPRSPAAGRPRLPRGRAWLAVATLLPLAFLASCTTEPSTTSNPTPPPAPAPGGANTTAPANAPAAGGETAAAQFEKPRKATGDIFIKIVTNGISPFWDPMAVGMEKAKGDVGCKAEWIGPRDATVTAQKQMVEDAITKGADGIAISCIEAKASEPIIQMILDKGIPVITFDSDSPGSKRLCYIGTNNVNAGKAAGEAAGKLLPKGGTFVGFVGNISAQNARERQQGFEEAAKAHGISLKEVMDDQKDATGKARSNVENAISKYSDQIQGLLGLFSYNGPAIAQAVGSAKLREKYKIVCFDAEPKTLQELEAGNIDATVVQKPYDFGYLSTKLLYLINRKGWSEAAKEMKIPANGVYDTGVDVIRPDNVKQYKQGLEKLGIKSS